MHREGVDDDMTLVLSRLHRDDVGQNLDEGSTGVAGHGLPNDLAGADVHRRVQLERRGGSKRIHGVRSGPQPAWCGVSVGPGGVCG